MGPDFHISAAEIDVGRLTLRHRFVPGKLRIVLEPGRTRAPVNRSLRCGSRIIVQRSCRDHHPYPIARQMRNFGAAKGTELQPKTLRVRQVIALYGLFAGGPAEAFGLREPVGGMRRTGCFAASRTMAVNKAQERNLDLVAHRFAQASARHFHGFHSCVTNGVVALTW